MDAAGLAELITAASAHPLTAAAVVIGAIIYLPRTKWAQNGVYKLLQKLDAKVEAVDEKLDTITTEHGERLSALEAGKVDK